MLATERLVFIQTFSKIFTTAYDIWRFALFEKLIKSPAKKAF